MNMSMKRLIFFFLILFFGNTASARFSCGKIFNNIQRVPLKKIKFAQNFLGYAWGNYLLKKLEVNYEKWREDNPLGNRQQFILEQTEAKPFPVFRDPDGHLRQFDRHHQHKIYQIFMGRRDFFIYVRFFFDYTESYSQNSKPWKKKEMMDHAISHGFVSLFGIEKPRFRDLKNLPQNINELPDLPIRSLISFIFRNLPFPLKGSDFQPMIQFKLAEFMIEEGIDIRPQNPFHESNIKKLTERFLKNPKILKFLADRISPRIPEERRKRISSFLKGQSELVLFHL